MDTATQDELRELQARAYGPGADIDQDPAALQRLRHLESARSGTAGDAADDNAPPPRPLSPATPAASPVDLHPELQAVRDLGLLVDEDSQPARSAHLERPDGAGDADGTPARTGASRRARTRGGLPRSVKVLWPLSLAGVAALSAGITYALTSFTPVSVSSGAAQIATLEPVAGAEIEAGWFGAGPSSRVYEYYGITLFDTAGGFGATGTDCFTAVATEDLPESDDDQTNGWSIDGMIYSGCSVGSFPATIQIPIDVSSPMELTEQFPDGGALQFVMDDERVGVFFDSD